MLDQIKYMIMFLLVAALCASWMIATEANAQTCGYGSYGPSYGYSSYPVAPMIAPAESPTEAMTTICTSSQTPGYATVSGIVTYINGTVVPGAVVQLQSKSGAQYSTTSGADGHYEIGNVKYDSYIFKYKRDGYESPAATMDVKTASIKRDISLPAPFEGSSVTAPAAIDHSGIKNWYATRYTPQTPSNKAVIYGQSGHIERVITGIPCQIF